MFFCLWCCACLVSSWWNREKGELSSGYFLNELNSFIYSFNQYSWCAHYECDKHRVVIYYQIWLMSAFSAKDRSSVCLRHSCVPRTQHSSLHVRGTPRTGMATSTHPKGMTSWAGLI